MSEDRPAGVGANYDRVADEYARRIYDELAHKPLDRQLLDRFAASMRGAGPVRDIGCGPGHVTRYLHERGVQIEGIDLSAALVESARRLNPGIRFRQGDMLALDAPDGAWSGVVAFYSIIHIPRPDVVRVLRELGRVLRPDGSLFIAFHVGDDVIHLDDWWGHSVSLDFILFRSDDMAGYLKAAGFEAIETIERDPYPDVEAQSRRSYMLARKPYTR